MIYILITLVGLVHLYETVAKAVVMSTAEDIKINYYLNNNISELKKNFVHVHMTSVVMSYAYLKGRELLFALRFAIACALIWHGASNLV